MKKNCLHWIVPAACVALLAPAPGSRAEDNTPARGVVKATAPAEAVANPVVRYQAADRRDPFVNPLLLKQAAASLDQEVARETPPPGISGMQIDEVTLVGISVQDEGRTAVFRGPDKRVYFLQQGDRLFDGFLKSILADSVQLVRETTMKSGKTLTQDVNKRLRTR